MTAFWTVFGLVFLAELGDKTQLALLGLAADRNPFVVWLAATAALAASSAVAVLVAAWLKSWLDPRWLHYLAALLFVGLGAAMLWRGPGLG